MKPRRSLLVLVLVCITALVVTACAPATGGIALKDPFSRASPGGATTGGAFVTITNSGKDADRLVSASSPAATTVELHETVMVDGVMKMEPHPEGWAIPAGGTLELAPGGKHIMLIDLVAPLEAGKSIELTLNFEKAGTKTIQVPVQKMGM